MTVQQLYQERIEVFSGIPAGEIVPRWFIDHCAADGKLMVERCKTKEEAMERAHGWGLPVVLI